MQSDKEFTSDSNKIFVDRLKNDLRIWDVNGLTLDGKFPGCNVKLLEQPDSDWMHGLNTIYNSCMNEDLFNELPHYSFDAPKFDEQTYEVETRSYDESIRPLFKLYQTEAPLVRSVMKANGFIETSSHDWQVMWSPNPIRDSMFEALHEHQRVNHFPGANELTRKDRMAVNIEYMRRLYGEKEFDFVPQTYVLPEEYDAFYKSYTRETLNKMGAYANPNDEPTIWIVKPAASSRGRGIYLLRDEEDLPEPDESCIIQKYVTNPFLIQGLKFDLRIYVLVTSYDPLKIYVYKDGLTRFACSTYNTNDLSRHRHLTNYSVNKCQEHYVFNQSSEEDNIGHKWSLAALNRHFKYLGIDTAVVWARIHDLLIKSIITVEHAVLKRVKETVPFPNNCFEVYGFDVLLDEHLKPWLLEVNLSPSLAVDTPLDMKIKSGMVSEALDLIGVPVAPKSEIASAKYRARMKLITTNAVKKPHAALQQSRAGRRLAVRKDDSVDSSDDEAHVRVQPVFARKPFWSRYKSFSALAQLRKKSKNSSQTAASSKKKRNSLPGAELAEEWFDSHGVTDVDLQSLNKIAQIQDPLLKASFTYQHAERVKTNFVRKLNENQKNTLVSCLHEFSKAKNYIRLFPTRVSARRYRHLISDQSQTTPWLIRALFAEPFVMPPKANHPDAIDNSFFDDDQEEDDQDIGGKSGNKKSGGKRGGKSRNGPQVGNVKTQFQQSPNTQQQYRQQQGSGSPVVVDRENIAGGFDGTVSNLLNQSNRNYGSALSVGESSETFSRFNVEAVNSLPFAKQKNNMATITSSLVGVRQSPTDFAEHIQTKNLLTVSSDGDEEAPADEHLPIASAIHRLLPGQMIHQHQYNNGMLNSTQLLNQNKMSSSLNSSSISNGFSSQHHHSIPVYNYGLGLNNSGQFLIQQQQHQQSSLPVTLVNTQQTQQFLSPDHNSNTSAASLPLSPPSSIASNLSPTTLQNIKNYSSAAAAAVSSPVFNANGNNYSSNNQNNNIPIRFDTPTPIMWPSSAPPLHFGSIPMASLNHPFAIRPASIPTTSTGGGGVIPQTLPYTRQYPSTLAAPLSSSQSSVSSALPQQQQQNITSAQSIPAPRSSSTFPTDNMLPVHSTALHLHNASNNNRIIISPNSNDSFVMPNGSIMQQQPFNFIPTTGHHHSNVLSGGVGNNSMMMIQQQPYHQIGNSSNMSSARLVPPTSTNSILNQQPPPSVIPVDIKNYSNGNGMYSAPAVSSGGTTLLRK